MYICISITGGNICHEAISARAEERERKKHGTSVGKSRAGQVLVRYACCNLPGPLDTSVEGKMLSLFHPPYLLPIKRIRRKREVRENEGEEYREDDYTSSRCTGG